MPAETHQRGPTIGPAEILAVMAVLSGDDVLESPDDVTLASLGVDDFSVSGLGLAVREEFAEPTMGTVGADVELSPAMTASVAAAAMAQLLRTGDDVHAS